MSRAQNPREEGHAAGVRCGKKIARIEAFGAIRRAVEVARRLDAMALQRRESLAWLHAEELHLRGDAVRCAIRAAIGSDKT